MKSPLCTHPKHPNGSSKAMLFLEEKAGAFVFACRACRDVNHVLSVRVVTGKALRNAVRSDLRSRGQLMTAPPKMMAPQYAPMKRPTLRWDEGSRVSGDGRVELVKFERKTDGLLQVQVAIDGKLAPMIDDDITAWAERGTDAAYFTRIAATSETFLHIYGDARHPHSEAEIERRSQETF